jgi:protein-tyrosine phosphatase
LLFYENKKNNKMNINKLLSKLNKTLFISTNDFKDMEISCTSGSIADNIKNNQRSATKRKYSEIIMVQSDIEMDAIIHKVNDYIYLSGWPAISDDISELTSRNIKHVFTIKSHTLPKEWYKKCKKARVNTYYYPLNDSITADIIPVATAIHAKLIQIKNNNESALIHCQKGVSRSASVVLFHSMQLKNNSKKEVNLHNEIRKLRKIRSTINPNAGFKQQLRSYFSSSDSGNDI